MEKTLLNKELQNYYTKLMSELKLTYSKKEAQEILASIQKNASTFFDENPDASFDDFIETFGTVDDFIEETVNVNNAKQISSKMHTSTFLKKCALTIVLLVTLVCLLKTALLFKAYHEAKDTEIDHSITVIE